jgi:Ras-related protein Rab-1A
MGKPTTRVTKGRDPVDNLIRLLIVGDTSVGKTSILLRFYEDSHNNNSKSTIGVDYRVREVMLDGSDSPIKLQIWDTAGQERFRSMTKSFYRRATGIIVTFDVLSQESWENLPGWLGEISKMANEGSTIIICANKADAPESTWVGHFFF